MVNKNYPVFVRIFIAVLIILLTVSFHSIAYAQDPVNKLGIAPILFCGVIGLCLFNRSECAELLALFDLWLHPIEHENESRSLAVGDVELLALISINIQEESAAALVAVASVVHDEGVLPYVGGLHKAVLLVLVGQLGHARNPRILSAAAVHDQLCTLRLS